MSHSSRCTLTITIIKNKICPIEQVSEYDYTYLTIICHAKTNNCVHIVTPVAHWECSRYAKSPAAAKLNVSSFVAYWFCLHVTRQRNSKYTSNSNLAKSAAEWPLVFFASHNLRSLTTDSSQLLSRAAIKHIFRNWRLILAKNWRCNRCNPIIVDKRYVYK